MTSISYKYHRLNLHSNLGKFICPLRLAFASDSSYQLVSCRLSWEMLVPFSGVNSGLPSKSSSILSALTQDPVSSFIGVNSLAHPSAVHVAIMDTNQKAIMHVIQFRIGVLIG